MTQSLRVACAGAGYFSQFHLDAWARMDRVALVGCVDRDVERARATGLPAYDDLSTLLEAQSPDVLDVIVPPVAQSGVIRSALAQGVKWIICQKPFCTSLAEARQITEEALAAGATIIIHENFRFQPWYRAIKAALDRNAVGQLHQITFRLRPGDGQGSDAYLARQPSFQRMERFLVRETAVHWIDTFRYLLGDPVSVYADLRQINPVIAGEDAGYILFEFPGGARALFDGNRHLDHATDNLRRTMGEALVEGTQGCLTLGGDGSVTLRKFATSQIETVLPADEWEGFGGDCVHALQAHVVAGILDNAPLENRAEEYLAVRRIEDAVYLSAQTGCKQSVSKNGEE